MCSDNEMQVFCKEKAQVKTLYRKLGKNSQHCSVILHTPFDERYKINGRQEAKVPQAHFEQVTTQFANCGRKKK